MLFSELAGDAKVDPAQTVKQITGWFRGEDKLVIVGMKSVRGPGQNVVSQTVTAKEFVEQLRGPGGVDLLEGLSMSSDGTRWDLYMSVATVAADGTVHRRGTIDDIESVPGVYVDLDVKSGSFESREDALAYLRKLPLPSLITATGSGGIHGYWRFPEPVDADTAANVQKSWWALLAERAAPIFVDRLIDASRVMRLSGTPRWPKTGETIPARLATVVYRNLDARYEPAKLLEWSADAAARRDEKVRSTRAKDSSRRVSAADLTGDIGEEGSWKRMMAVANVEDTFNARVTWDEILVPSGWQFLREDRSGRREWARPGSNSKSASTDYSGSAAAMSLHSWSPATGLSDLKEANIPLSKWRVALRFLFDDDYDKIVAWTLENG
jgi:hypothetical protein